MYVQNLNSRLRRMRDDGATETAVSETEAAATVNEERARRGAYVLGELIGGPQRRRAGLQVNGTFFPLSDILSFATLVTIIIVACKRK